MDIEIKKTEKNHFTNKDFFASAIPSLYLKLQKGETRLRILNVAPVVGFEVFIQDAEGKHTPIRKAKADGTFNAQELKELEKKNFSGEPLTVREFRAMLIYNHDLDAYQIWQFTQSSIRTALNSFQNSPSWGKYSLSDFDIIVTKSGDGMETRYEIKTPPEAVYELSKKIINNIPYCDLTKLFSGEDPFTR